MNGVVSVHNPIAKRWIIKGEDKQVYFLFEKDYDGEALNMRDEIEFTPVEHEGRMKKAINIKRR